MVSSLNYLDAQVNTLLGFKVFNGTEILDLTAGVQGLIKKIPAAMGVQFTILIMFMFFIIGGIFYHKRRMEREKAEREGETTGIVKSERKEREEMEQISV